MARNDELKEIDVKNCTCYYFDSLIIINYFNPRKHKSRFKSSKDIDDVKWSKDVIWCKIVVYKFL